MLNISICPQAKTDTSGQSHRR